MNDKVNNFDQIAYIRRYTMTDGKAAGLKIAEIDNGKLRFLLNESKALDIPQLWHNGMNIGFVSKSGLDARLLPFARRFEGGMLYTCGPDSIGARDGYELHGNLHNIPAKIVNTVCNEEKISVTAEIEDTELFGKNLLLRRTVETAVNSDSLTLKDTLINRGARDENYCLLYHVNLGYPFLDEGVTIQADESQVVPRTDIAKKRLSDRTSFSKAVANEEERCYFIRHNVPAVKAVNKKIGKTFTLSYSADSLPCFIQWNSSSIGDYAMGLEPSTSFLDDNFRYNTLAAGSSAEFKLTVTIE